MTSEAPESEVPAWLTRTEAYEPRADRDGYIVKSALALSSALARLRFDDGAATPLSPSAITKLFVALSCILLVSLSRNLLFMLILLAAVLARAAALPTSALRRVAATSCTAALLAFVVMLPATLLGQPRSALNLALKALISTALVMEVTLTTPPAELTSALRAVHVPNLVILTIDLTLRSIVRLGEVALEVLTALRLRSVGHNREKSASLGGVGGVVLIKAAEAAQDTHDAMRCRGFEGEYEVSGGTAFSWKDIVWIVLLCGVTALFLYLQRQV